MVNEERMKMMSDHAVATVCQNDGCELLGGHTMAEAHLRVIWDSGM